MTDAVSNGQDHADEMPSPEFTVYRLDWRDNPGSQVGNGEQCDAFHQAVITMAEMVMGLAQRTPEGHRLDPGQVREIFQEADEREQEDDLGMDSEHEVLIVLEGIGVCTDKDIYTRHDVFALQRQLTAIIDENQLGEFDGNCFGPDNVILYMYGNDAEKLIAGIEPALLACPLCKGATVVVRKGHPSTPEYEYNLP